MSAFEKFSKSLRLVCGVGLLAATSVWAAPVALNTGDTLTLNFNAKAYVPYNPLSVRFQTIGFDDMTESVMFSVFSGLNGTGVHGGSVGGAVIAGGEDFGSPSGAPEFFDGEFSAVLTDLAGSYSVDLWAEVTTLDNNGARVITRIEGTNPNAVPEPASLALVGIALAGLGLSRRHKAN